MGNSLTRINQARRERDQARKERDQARRERDQAEWEKSKVVAFSWFLLFLIAGFLIGLGAFGYRILVSIGRFLINNSFPGKEIKDKGPSTLKDEDKGKLTQKHPKPKPPAWWAWSAPGR